MFGGYILDVPITAHHHHNNLNPKSFKGPFATRNASLARAGAAGEQATDHHLGNLTTESHAKLTRRSCIPQQASAGASTQS